MTPQQIVGLGVRLFAAWLALRGGPWLVQGMMGTDDPASASLARGLVVSGVGYLAVAAVVWNMPMWIAHKVVPKTAYDNNLNLSLFEAARVGGALIGLWLLATTVQNIVWFIITAMVAGGSESVFAATSKENRIALALDLFQVVFGLLLIFRSQWFARLVAK